jgi:hypothetical protein
VALQIEEEVVLPRALAQRPRLDLDEIDAVSRERLQQAREHADLVPHADDDRGLVVAGRPVGVGRAQDQEPGDVAGLVLDAVASASSRRVRRRLRRGDRRHAALPRARRAAARCWLPPSRARRAGARPATAALRERLRMAATSADARERGAGRTSRQWRTGSAISAQIVQRRSTSRSSVWATMPSLEFSTGTTPTCARRASTSRNTSAMAATGM